MMLCKTLLVILSAVCVSSKDLGTREPKFFRGQYTKTIIRTNLATSLIPSSCIQVDATLPPCRNVRFLRFPSFSPKKNPAFENNAVEPESKDEETTSTSLTWGEYLGVYAPTVTVTKTRIFTTTVEDPQVVVTYAVKGCAPLKLPMEMKRCDGMDLDPSSTVLAPITPTAINEGNVNELEAIRDESALQGSAQENGSGVTETQALPA